MCDCVTAKVSPRPVPNSESGRFRESQKVRKSKQPLAVFSFLFFFSFLFSFIIIFLVSLFLGSFSAIIILLGGLFPPLWL